VVLPQRLSVKDWEFWLGLVAWNPLATWKVFKSFSQHARGRIVGIAGIEKDWYQFVLPEVNAKLRREHRNWARFVLLGHLALAVTFMLTGHWFLIVVFTIGTQYCNWLGILTGTPPHFGISPNVADFRLCCRTYTCSWLPAFYYWNMQYHIEHHMFPAVPFYNLPKLRKAIQHDLPPAPHGLVATWKHILEIHQQQTADPRYAFIPLLPSSTGEHAADEVLEREAALNLTSSSLIK
jgi:fatty acid desaturase